jgi:hypothetical protein
MRGPHRAADAAHVRRCRMRMRAAPRALRLTCGTFGRLTCHALCRLV